MITYFDILVISPLGHSEGRGHAFESRRVRQVFQMDGRVFSLFGSCHVTFM